MLFRDKLTETDKTTAVNSVNSGVPLLHYCIIYKFIWKGTDKIKRLAIISDYKNGGLRMPHIETLIDTHRIMCLKKYSQDYISPWKHILSFF